MTQLEPIQLWKLISPWVVWAVKFGASELILSDIASVLPVVAAEPTPHAGIVNLSKPFRLRAGQKTYHESRRAPAPRVATRPRKPLPVRSGISGVLAGTLPNPAPVLHLSG